MDLKKLAAALKRNKKFLITAHVNPEGDAIGSQLAFLSLLKKLGKSAIIVNEDAVPYEYGFLPGKDNIVRFKDKPRRLGFDAMIVLDCSDLKRAGEVYRLNTDKKLVINIDHHISNQRFGDLNWVEPGSSSTSEMVYKLYKELRVPLDRNSAICLYTGIMTDTGSFRYTNTTSFTHQAVSELLKFDVDAPGIYKNIYANVPYADMKLLSRILTGMKREAQGRLIWFQIRRSLLRGKKISFDLADHVLSFGRAVKDAEVVVLFKENLGAAKEVRVNFRSQGRYDVNRIAKYFGGGGHKTASGATICGALEPVRKKVLARIREGLR